MQTDDILVENVAIYSIEHSYNDINVWPKQVNFFAKHSKALKLPKMKEKETVKGTHEQLKILI